jgi:hypothetical protein
MTTVYCWLDKSLSRERIAAVADSRISEQTSKDVWRPLHEETIKLFRVPVRCYSMDTFDCRTGSWNAPYFETEVGVAFAGDCFEAISVLNAFGRAAAQLVVDGEDRPCPSPNGLYGLLKEAGDKWLSAYKRPTAKVQFLLLGYSAEDGAPWVGKLLWPYVNGSTGNQLENPLHPSSLFFIGAEGSPGGSAQAQRIRESLLSRAEKLNAAELRKAGFEPDMEQAKALNADRMKLEDDVASLLMSDKHATVGGVMQKMEVFAQPGNRAVISFSRDDAQYADLNTKVAPGLAYVSVSSVMGTKGRPRPFDDSVVE